MRKVFLALFILAAVPRRAQRFSNYRYCPKQPAEPAKEWGSTYIEILAASGRP